MAGTLSRIAAPAAGIVALLLVAPALAFNLNKSIKIDDGSQSEGRSTVNGSISVGRDAVIDGSLETVNGTIRVDENTRLGDAETVNGAVRLAAGVTAKDVSSVNGSVSLAENVTIDGGVSVVNGKISIDAGSSVDDDVTNVNGEIRIEGTEIGGDLSTVNGDVWLTSSSLLNGNLVVEKPSGWGHRNETRKPKVVVGPNTEIRGYIKLEREVELYISESAVVGEVKGVMSMADAVRFSGERP